MSEKRRVVAYPMHTSDKARAAAALGSCLEEGTLLIGEADTDAIDNLRKQGVVLRDFGPATRASAAAVPDVPPDGYVVVKVLEPLAEPHRLAIEAAGLELTDRLGQRAFVARVKRAGAAGTAAALAFVDGVVPYQATVQKQPKARARKRRIPATGEAAPALEAAMSAPADRTYDVFLHAPDHRDAVEAFAKQEGIAVLGRSTRKVRVKARADQAEKLNELDAVALVEEYVLPTLCNDRARRVVWPEPPADLTLTGDGEIVAVADSGLDLAHVAFKDRVLKTFAHGRPNETSDPHGHGTHVAATIVGASGRQRGLASGAKLVFQSVMDAQGDLNFPVDLGDLLAEAYDAGARIHSDSWGADLQAAYPMTSFEIDAFVHAKRDMLVVIAAGNAGSALAPNQGPRRAAPGFVEWGSVGAPATAKNALVVGASRSDRKEGGLAPLKYGEAYEERFVDPPIAEQTVLGDPECLAAFSSRGPCNDHRIKPDVVAPGTDILSAKASTAPPQNFSGVEEIDGAAYGYMGGTSMATPLVAALAALVRQYLRTQRDYATPSAALLKAIIINGTRRLSGEDALADQQTDLPNFHQGFGGVFVSTTLPLDGSFTLAFVDNWQRPEEHFKKAGMAARYTFTTTKRAPLRITLAYTDAPGRSVQNDVSLILELPGAGKRLGNEKVPLAVFHPDPDNNVETIRIDDAPPGKYLVQVQAGTILVVKPAQDFALVVTGALAKPELERG